MKNSNISTKPINMLDDDCLIAIFLHVPIAQRLELEKVCERWRSIGREFAWQDTKTLNINFDYFEKWTGNNHCLVPMYTEKFYVKNLLNRCGRYLNKLRLHNSSSNLLFSIYENCKILQKLNLSFKTCDDKDFNAELFSSMDKLKYLKIELPIDNDAVVKNLSNALKKVSKNIEKISLIFHGQQNEIFVLPDLKQWHSLHSIKLEQHIINNLAMSKISECKNLKSLKLIKCQGIDDCSLLCLEKLDHLEELIIIGNSSTTITGSSFGQLSSLRKLECNGCVQVSDPGIIGLLQNAKNLEILNLLETSTSIKILKFADNITEKRTNDILLKMRIDFWKKSYFQRYKKSSPLLIVEYDDYKYPL